MPPNLDSGLARCLSDAFLSLRRLLQEALHPNPRPPKSPAHSGDVGSWAAPGREGGRCSEIQRYWRDGRGGEALPEIPRCLLPLPSEPSWAPPPPPTTSPIFPSQMTPAGDTGFPFILPAAPQGSSGPQGHPGVSRGSRFSRDLNLDHLFPFRSSADRGLSGERLGDEKQRRCPERGGGRGQKPRSSTEMKPGNLSDPPAESGLETNAPSSLGTAASPYKPSPHETGQNRALPICHLPRKTSAPLHQLRDTFCSRNNFFFPIQSFFFFLLLSKSQSPHSPQAAHGGLFRWPPMRFAAESRC